MKIFCIAANYRKHNEELNFEVPKNPVFFIKPETALLRNNSDFYYPDFSHQIEYETEIVVRISKMGKCISPKFASRYYDEIGIGLDITARDLQNELRAKGLPWFQSKGFDCAAPISPTFLPKEKFASLNDISFSLKINGEVVQSGNTGDMIFSIDDIVSYVSQFVTFKTGDLIFTGTPSGIGELHIGDFAEAFIGDTKLLEMRVK
ncbi:MAG: fumarylacetoacetate hydrolase family protein [Bacteroidales bacterium]|nr:fumarylacetoacetate hydrolase family protein [Bacteroidales bacterium]